MKLPFAKNKIDITQYFSYATVVYFSVWLLLGISVTALFLDIWVFYAYGYKIVNTSVTNDYTITLKRKELSEFINVLDERKNKSDSILQYGISDAPVIFR